jgi:hypothetical protein
MYSIAQINTGSIAKTIEILMNVVRIGQGQLRLMVAQLFRGHDAQLVQSWLQLLDTHRIWLC